MTRSCSCSNAVFSVCHELPGKEVVVACSVPGVCLLSELRDPVLARPRNALGEEGDRGVMSECHPIESL